MDNFMQFQLKEYENISQAHFKTNEVLATFYRYFLLIAAIPLTAVGVGMINLTEGGIGEEGRFLAYKFFGISTIVLSIVGAAVISYIEGLRLDSILYARVVNSIRNYFFDLPESGKFGSPVLPTDRTKPAYDGFGAGFFIYFACAFLNSSYAAVGVIALSLDYSKSLVPLNVSGFHLDRSAIAFIAMFTVHILVRKYLHKIKIDKGY